MKVQIGLYMIWQLLYCFWLFGKNKILRIYMPSLIIIIIKGFFQTVTLTVQFNQLIYTRKGGIPPY